MTQRTRIEFFYKKILTLKDKLLWFALLLCVGVSLVGAQWGKVEDWNLDQLAFRGVPTNLMVGEYLKPPLTTYVARLLVLNPVDCVMKGVFHSSTKVRLEARVLGVRFLTILYLCVAIALLYFSVCRCSGRKAGGTLALLMATSAGLIVYTHYGTADMPLVFWMVASFTCALHAALSGQVSFAIAAGLLAGLSAACKYNGLGVAIALPVFFLIQEGPKEALLKKNLWLASLAVPLGFVLGCPGALFDHKHFVQDFLYNLYTTPVYGGETSHPGYKLFLNYIPSLIGWPGSLVLVGCLVPSLFLFVLNRLKKEEVLLMGGALAVFFFYFLTIGRFPRMEMRFVLPVVPFLLVAAAPALSRINKYFLMVILVPLLAYNLICCFFVGCRFLKDPRMEACDWAEQHFKAGDIIESSCAPYWNDLIPGLKVIHMPLFTGRTERFKKIFRDNSVIAKGLSRFDNDPSLEIFTRETLQQRNPDYMTFSFYAIAFSGDPFVQQYYKDHLAGKLGYHLVWQATCWLPPRWAYPQSVDFLVPEMYILKKD